jgi:hypothetical protein
MVPAEDPFASIPDAVANPSPAASSGSMKIPSNYANPYAKPTAPKTVKKSGFNWQVYWPVIAIASAASVAIPIVIYALFFMGSSGVSSVASVPDPANPDVKGPDAQVDPSNRVGKNNPLAGIDADTNKKTGGNTAVNKGGKGVGGGGKGKGNSGGNAQVVIRTSTGRGADTTVAPNLSGKQGSLSTIAVRDNPKKPRDLSHGYLRFDLASMPFQKQNIDSVTLTLAVSGASRPAQASFKVHGVTNQLPQDWSESGLGELVWSESPSKNQFASLPVIAEASITGQPDPADGNRNLVVFEGTKLADFFRESESELVTLVISGGASNAKSIRFHSRENKDGVVTPSRGAFLLIKAKKKGA